MDHARRLNTRFEFPAFRDQILKCFKDDGLHDLVIALRILLHHLHVVKASWSLRADYRDDIRSAYFEISRSEIERALEIFPVRFGGNNGRLIRVFLSKCADQINVRSFFDEYRSRIERFYNWLNDQIECSPPDALKDYDRCIQEKRKYDTRMSWNAIIGIWLNWESVPDIHKHLPNYLDAAELKSVCDSPRNSKAQANLIIGFLDKDGAVDDRTRERIHKLFERLEAQEQDN